MKLDVPPLVRQRAMANGVAGRHWLDSLPEAIAALAARWELTLGDTFSDGTAGLVVAATDANGNARVLKVAMPLDANDEQAFQRSVVVHRLANGRGCARLFEHDDATPAVLLERLGSNLDELGLQVPEILEVVASTLKVFWRPVDPSCGLPTGADKAAWLAEYVVATWDELGRPCEPAVIDRVLEYCDERAAAFDPAGSVLVHGDAHGWNTVEAGDGSFKLVDPEGLVSEPAHDLSVPMREYNSQLLAGDTPRLVRDRAELLAEWCNVDPESVWQWGYIERVSTGLAAARDLDAGSDFLEVARRCL